MIDRGEHFRQKADECERLAATRSDPKLRASYVDMAKRWREMADQTEAMGRVVANIVDPRPPHDTGSSQASEPEMPVGVSCLWHMSMTASPLRRKLNEIGRVLYPRTVLTAFK